MILAYASQRASLPLKKWPRYTGQNAGPSAWISASARALDLNLSAQEEIVGTVKQAARREQNRRYRAKHPLLDIWRGMRRRCERPTARSYEYYGGKGIKVCPEWRSFLAFEAWILANLGPRPEGMTLDRIDGWGDYEPGNVRWATHAEQYRNRMPPWWDWPEFAERRKAQPHRHVRIGDGELVYVECTDPACPMWSVQP